MSLINLLISAKAGVAKWRQRRRAFDELLARLRAVQRRAVSAAKAMLQVSDLTLDPASHEVSRAGERISLTRTEYSLLERLMYRPGQVVPRRSLIEAVWGFDREIEENTLDAFMHLLRTKVDLPAKTKLICGDLCPGAGGIRSWHVGIASAASLRLS